jgi:hypothetical protein
MENNPNNQWDQNQPKSWQWVLIIGIFIVLLCGISTFIIFAYQTYNRWIEDWNRYYVQETSTADAYYEEKISIIDEAKSWQLVMLDTFDNNQNDWMEGEVDDEYTLMTLTLDGKYTWDAVAKRGFTWRIWPDSGYHSDFYMAVDAYNSSTNNEAEYGLIFRNYERSYFLLEVSEAGYFRVLSHDDQGWDELISSTQTKAIHPGGINYLEIVSVDDTFYFVINDEYVGSASGSIPSEGQVGLAIGLNTEGERSTIVFDNFELRAP